MAFRGDAHRLYEKVKHAVDNGTNIEDLPEIKEMQAIDQFYDGLSRQNLELIRYRMLKEKDGNGMIPLLISALPWLGFLLSKQPQTVLLKSYVYVFIFLILYTVVTTVSVIIHYREKAWACVHIDMIDNKLKQGGPK